MPEEVVPFVVDLFAGGAGEAAAADAITAGATGAFDAGAFTAADVGLADAALTGGALAADAAVPSLTATAAAPEAASIASLAGTEGTAFLPATVDASAVPLSSDLATSLGVTPDVAAPAALDVSSTPVDFSAPVGSGDLVNAQLNANAADAAGGGGGSITSWIAKNPGLAAQLGLTGLSAFEAFSTPQLPGAAKSLLSNLSPATKQAMDVISSGGTNTPLWAQQKASIDATIAQQQRLGEEGIMQAAANLGEGGKDSQIVQDKIRALRRDLETQRQNMYAQAQQQNVSNATAELTGSNQTLMAIAQMQMGEDSGAQQTANTTARLAGQLAGMTTKPSATVQPGEKTGTG